MNPLLVLAFLILACGFFALAEMALAASRRPRLQQLADAGNTAAAHALTIKSTPSRFIAATQTGLTAASLLAGIYGENALAGHLEQWIGQMLPFLDSIKAALAMVVTITVVTAFAIVFGEIVPKRIALSAPEKVASAVAPFMGFFIALLSPAIRLLSWSADAVLKLLGVRSAPELTGVEDILALVDESERDGAIAPEESHLLWNVFRLEDRHVAAVMTPLKDVAFLDLNRSHAENLHVIRDLPHGRYPVCRGSLQHVQGLAESRALLTAALSGDIRLAEIQLAPPLYVPSALTLIDLLRSFRQHDTDFAFVVNEFGDTEGVVTMADLFQTVAGDMMPGRGDAAQALAVQREDGSWLLDGLLPLDEMREKLALPEMGDAVSGLYHTVGGFVVAHMGKIPRRAEKFSYLGWVFEVVDMDHNRVDEVLVTRESALAKPGS